MKTPRSIVIRPGSGKKLKLELKRDDHTWRSHTLLRWSRGFSMADAPPDPQNCAAPSGGVRLQRLDTTPGPVL